MANNRYRLKPDEEALLLNYRKHSSNNILVIGDLHEPFTLDGYLDFCKEQYIKHECNEVIFIGDILDNHYSSFHEVNIDAEYTGKTELELAIKKLSKWYEAFEEATVIIGNHDRLIMRKAQTSAIPSKWIKSYKEVLEVPKWHFTERYVKHNVQFIHGEAGTARTKCRADMMNTIQGHLHTQAYCEHYVGQNYRVYGMQVGCGIDFKSYAMAYAKAGKKPAIACGVVKDNGTLPINILMPL
jgi:metallophosphoesterase superfamily enzyme